MAKVEMDSLTKFEISLETYLDAQLKGESSDAVSIVQKAKAVSVHARSRLLQKLICIPATERSICTASFMLQVGVNNSAQAAAISHLNSELVHCGNLAGAAWSMLNGLDELPKEFFPSLERALKSGDEVLELFAATNGIKQELVPLQPKMSYYRELAN